MCSLLWRIGRLLTSVNVRRGSGGARRPRKSSRGKVSVPKKIADKLPVRQESANRLARWMFGLFAAGVAVLVDLGGAETNSEMAIELLPEECRERVVICTAPIVEGAVVAATEASGGASLVEVRATAPGMFATA